MSMKEQIEIAAKELGVRVDWKAKIKPGDLYFAGRNTGPHLLTCKYVSSDNFIVPVEAAYPFDIGECAKVIP